MLLPDHQYVTTDSLKESLRLLAENGDKAMVVAGGTDGGLRIGAGARLADLALANIAGRERSVAA